MLPDEIVYPLTTERICLIHHGASHTNSNGIAWSVGWNPTTEPVFYPGTLNPEAVNDVPAPLRRFYDQIEQERNTDPEIKRMNQLTKRSFRHDAFLCSCAACGMRSYSDVDIDAVCMISSPSREMTHEIASTMKYNAQTSQDLQDAFSEAFMDLGAHYIQTPLSSMKALQYTEEQSRTYTAIPDEYKPAISSHVATDSSGFPIRMHLHSELVFKDTADAFLCETCHENVTKGDAVPIRSIAGGCDLGHPSRIGLNPLSIFETVCLQQVRLYAVLISLTSATNKYGCTAIVGNVIAFPTDASEQCLKAACYPSVKGMSQFIRLSFLGGKSKFIDAIRPADGIKNLVSGSIKNLRAYHLAMRALQPSRKHDLMDSRPETEQQLDLDKEVQDIIDQAHIGEDERDTWLFRAVSSDVAAVNAELDPKKFHQLNSKLLIGRGIASTETQDALRFLLTLKKQSTTKADQSKKIDGCESEGELLGSKDSFSDVEMDQPPNENASQQTNIPMESEPNDQGPVDVVITRETEPLNMFSQNRSLLYGAFPHRFFLGKGLSHEGPLDQKDVNHLLMQHTNVFSGDKFIHWPLFSQHHIRSILGQSSIRVKQDSTSIKTVIDTVNDPTFQARLDAAVKSPESSDAKQLIRILMPHIQFSGAKDAFGPMQRSRTKGQLIAIQKWYGMFSVFLTSSPSLEQHSLTQRLAQPSTSNRFFPATPESFADQLLDEAKSIYTEFISDLRRERDGACKIELPITYADLSSYIRSNPTASVLVFKRALATILNHLLATPPCFGRKQSIPLRARPRSMFGRSVMSIGVLEEQDRGTLHAHLMWLGGLSPPLLQHIAECPALMDHVASVLATMFTTELPRTVHLDIIKRKARNEYNGFPSLLPTPAFIPASGAYHEEIEQERTVAADVRRIMLQDRQSNDQPAQAMWWGRIPFIANVVGIVHPHTSFLASQLFPTYEQCDYPGDGEGPWYRLPERRHLNASIRTWQKLVHDARVYLCSNTSMVEEIRDLVSQYMENPVSTGNHDILDRLDAYFCSSVSTSRIVDTSILAFSSKKVVYGFKREAGFYCHIRYSAGGSQFHEPHVDSCHKLPGGEYRCRFSFPGAIVEKTRAVEIIYSKGSFPEYQNWEELPIVTPRPIPPSYKHTDFFKRPVGSIDSRMLVFELKRPELSPLTSGELADIDSEMENGIYAVPAREHMDIACSSESEKPMKKAELIFRSMIKKWPLRNGLLVPSCDLLMSTSAGNESVNLLGSKFQSQITGHYLSSYLSKDKVPLSSILVVMSSAFRKCLLYHSKASDNGERGRNTLYFLQKSTIALGAEMEISDQQAVAALLGIQSDFSSELAQPVYASAAVAFMLRHVGVLNTDACYQQTGADIVSPLSIATCVLPSVSLPDTAVLVNECHGSHEGIQDVDIEQTKSAPLSLPSAYMPDADMPNFEYQGSYDDIHDVDMEMMGSAPMTLTGVTGHKVAVILQHISYRFRGPELELLPFIYYQCMISVVRKKTETGASHLGRLNNKRFALHPSSPLALTHEQELRSIQAYPQCIATPPTAPPEIPKILTAAFKKSALAFTVWYITMFMPWNVETGVPVQIAPGQPIQWSVLVNFMKSLHASDSVISGATIHIINSMSQPDSLTSETRQANTSHRNRSATVWSKEEREASKKKQGDSSLREDEATVAARLIDELRNLANCDMRESRQQQEKQSYVNASCASFSSVMESPDSEPISSDRSSAFNTSHQRSASTLFNKPIISNCKFAAVTKAAASLLDPVDLKKKDKEPASHIPTSTGAPAAAAPETLRDSPNAEQQLVINEVIRFVCDVKAFEDRNVLTQPSLQRPVAPLLFLHAGPGAGKSFLAKAVQKEAELHNSGHVTTAVMGVACSNVKNAITTHRLLSLSSKSNNSSSLPGGDSGSNIPNSWVHANDLNSAALKDSILLIKDLFRNKHVLMIDELSMYTTTMLALLERRARQAKEVDLPWGGMSVICIGDLFQLEAMFGDSIYKTMMSQLVINTSKVYPSLPKFQGAVLFRDFRLVTLKANNRTLKDPVRTAFINHLRSTTIEYPINDKFISSMQILSTQDLVDNPHWRFATLLGTSNPEQYAHNRYQQRQFALINSTVVIRWKNLILNTTASTHPGLYDKYYDTYPELWGSFVQKAPAFIAHNYCNDRFVCNGGGCIMHSLTLGPDYTTLEIAELNNQIRHAQPGTEIILPRPPFSLNVMMPLTEEDACMWTPKQCLFHELNLTSTSKSVVIPLTGLARYPEKISVGGNLTLRYIAIKVDMGFAKTIHKTQGLTEPLIIMDVNLRPAGMKAMTLASFFVGYSRVTDSKNFRILPPHPGKNFDHLKQLKHDPLLICFLAGYGPDGKWNADLAKLQYDIRFKQTTNHKTKSNLKTVATTSVTSKSSSSAAPAFANLSPVFTSIPVIPTGIGNAHIQVTVPTKLNPFLSKVAVQLTVPVSLAPKAAESNQAHRMDVDYTHLRSTSESLLSIPLNPTLPTLSKPDAMDVDSMHSRSTSLLSVPLHPALPTLSNPDSVNLDSTKLAASKSKKSDKMKVDSANSRSMTLSTLKKPETMAVDSPESRPVYHPPFTYTLCNQNNLCFLNASFQVLACIKDIAQASQMLPTILPRNTTGREAQMIIDALQTRVLSPSLRANKSIHDAVIRFAKRECVKYSREWAHGHTGNASEMILSIISQLLSDHLIHFTVVRSVTCQCQTEENRIYIYKDSVSDLPSSTTNDIRKQISMEDVQFNSRETARRRCTNAPRGPLCLHCTNFSPRNLTDGDVLKASDCLVHSDAQNLRLLSSDRAFYYPKPRESVESHLIIPYRSFELDSVLALINRYFHDESITGYKCIYCGASEHSLTQSILCRKVVSFPKILIVEIESVSSLTGNVQWTSHRPLTEFLNLDLSSLVDPGQSSKCQYTLKSVVIKLPNHFVTYVRGSGLGTAEDPDLYIDDETSRRATDKDYQIMLTKANILVYMQDGIIPPRAEEALVYATGANILQINNVRSMSKPALQSGDIQDHGLDPSLHLKTNIHQIDFLESNPDSSVKSVPTQSIPSSSISTTLPVISITPRLNNRLNVLSAAKLPLAELFMELMGDKEENDHYWANEIAPSNSIISTRAGTDLTVHILKACIKVGSVGINSGTAPPDWISNNLITIMMWSFLFANKSITIQEHRICHQVTDDQENAFRLVGLDITNKIIRTDTDDDRTYEAAKRYIPNPIMTDTEKLLFPACIGSTPEFTMNENCCHFVIAVVDMKTSKIYLRDSMPKSEKFDGTHQWLACKIQACMSSIHKSRSDPKTWKILIRNPETKFPVLEQINTSDCGFHLLCHIAHRIFGTDETVQTVTKLRKITPLFLLTMERSLFTVNIIQVEHSAITHQEHSITD